MAVLGNRVIKSIQRGQATLGDDSSSDTDTITAVDLTKSMLNFIGPGSMKITSGTNVAAGGVRAYLSNSTTITVDAQQSLYRCSYSWEVIEYA